MERYSSTIRFTALDSWRGVCALLVAVHHFGYWHLYSAPFVRNSSLFVDFFFVLSGFVITHAYGQELDDRRHLAAFMLRRFGRLWPLHVTILAALVFLQALKVVAHNVFHLPVESAAFDKAYSLESIPANFILIQELHIFGPAATWNVPSWSISAEIWTYLLFAVVCLFSPRRPAMLMVAIALSAASVILFLSGGLIEDGSLNNGFFRCIYGFFVGHLVYRARSRATAGGLLEFFAIALVISFVSVSGRGNLSMAAPLVFGFAVWVFAHEKGWVSKVLTTQPFVNLGAWSYSIYMVHWLVLAIISQGYAVIAKLIGRPTLHHIDVISAGVGQPVRVMFFGSTEIMDVVLLGYLVAVVALSAVTYKLIEDPARKRFNRLAVRIFAADSAGRALSRALGLKGTIQ